MPTHRSLFAPVLTVALAAVASAVLPAPAAGAAPSGRLTLTSAPPTSTNVDVGTPGVGVGDSTTFYAAVTDKAGKAVGWLYGTKTLVATPGEAGMASDRGLFENLLTFRFADGSTIVVGGIQTAVLGAAGFNGSADPGDRAVVGGTGRYAGARGVLSTSANPDGSRKQAFTFSR